MGIAIRFCGMHNAKHSGHRYNRDQHHKLHKAVDTVLFNNFPNETNNTL
jgi:hypothetical protein